MTPKMTKKRLSLKKRGLVTTVQPKPEFSRTCGFREVLGIKEDCLERKISSKSIEPPLRYGQETSKIHQHWGVANGRKTPFRWRFRCFLAISQKWL